MHVTVTGARGFLGSTVVRHLRDAGHEVLALDREDADVTSPEQLSEAIGPTDVIVHCAAIVTIEDIVSPEVHAVNVDGVRNILDVARRHGARLVYVSSVHALTEAAPGVLMAEQDHFDPDRVVGAYAKTKAEAAQLVLDATDVDSVILHPSGILGPGDPGDTNLTTLVRRFMSGELTSFLEGGHDMVDVRDVADAVVAACRTGTGCYLVTGHHLSVREIGEIVTGLVGRRKPVFIPRWLAAGAAVPAEWIGRLFGRAPLFTRYSLHALGSGTRFTSARARRDLGFRARPVSETLRDMVADLSGD